MGLGIDGVFYRNTATFGTPTWDAVPGISDCVVNSDWDSGDGSTRVSPVKMSEPTQLDLNVSFKHIADGGADYLALAAAFYGRDDIDVMVLDGASTVNGVEGVRFVGKLHKWTQSQGLGDVLFRDSVIKPSIQATNKPQTVAVASGAPVFTTIA